MYAIIFDFDGTILDTETAEYLAWNEIYNQFGFSLEKENWEHRVGFCGENVFHPLSNLQNLINVEIDIDKLQQNRRAILWGYLSEMKTQPGVIELLEEAKCNNILTGIASSSPSKWVKQHVLRLGIAEYFNAIKCADDVCLLKPNPDLYVSVIT